MKKENVGPAFAVTLVILCTIMLGYFAYLSYESSVQGYAPKNTMCGPGEVDVKGYCYLSSQLPQ